ncbi:DEAD/DEAH box helicase family protein [Heyndrickxia sporothermodurans]|uniref:Helicase ATP-binding domain-containing protein n=3 Tax=Heyndrickxia sporothermodurans TaxID=46224 RepID=A0AB37H8H3_9BACI|nr:DEAD/DEAH box helicase family protein [Heyndrickxia sporothermodurans]MBL5769273.1 DNA helicase [Heyndrickxia sporothermodurans]MBL5773058.1 DNA helicase [Heyndrickxia sporothermodurans]MBL5776539.1 DNA helicase [Heyndrickxia sporothermodurans]MBL5780019.1 DNA helicase [Heyndrickxia sporothermodurans]MBL5787145.1 DNA helicase [Heyndrickxia sporothermodurans]
MKKWVSEVVTQDEIKKWNNGDIITISAGTGAGKSRFIKVSLYAHAKRQGKKILFLIHRTNCVNQFQMEIEKDYKTDIIDIKTYQHIEAKIRYDKNFDFSEYQYIVCDEFHYFMQDYFNKYTDISLNAILNQTDKIRIFMSATGDVMEKYLSGFKKIDVTPYKISIDYNFIRKLIFFNKDETFEQVIQQAIDENKKAIFFIDSAEKAYNLYKKYKEHCLFNCSKHNDKYYKYVDEEKINQMLLKERFEENILITTTCLDTGVNIIDKDLYCIFCDVKDIRTLIQCIGRKRIQDKDDKIELYIKSVNNKQLGGMITELNKRMDMARYLKDHSAHEYIEKYPRDYDKYCIVYADKADKEKDTVNLNINYLIYIKYVMDCATYQQMVKEEFGYCKFMARMFGFYDPYQGYDYVLFDEEYKNNNLMEYLDSITGHKLLKENQKELIEKIDLRVDGRQQKSYKKLNEGLEMIKLPLYLIN